MYIVKINNFYLSDRTDMTGFRSTDGTLEISKINNIVLTQDFKDAMMFTSEVGVKAIAKASKGKIFKIEEVAYNG